MNKINICTAVFVISFTCLSDPINGRPTSDSSRASTAVGSDFDDNHLSQTSLEDEDVSDEDDFESNEYPDDLYDDSNADNLSEEKSNSEADSASHDKVSQLHNNTFGGSSSHTAVGEFSESSDQTDAEFDQPFKVSKRHSGALDELPNNRQAPEVHSAPPADADVGIVRDVTADVITSGNNNDREGTEESAGTRQGDQENVPHKRGDVELVVPACPGEENNNTTDGTGGLSLDGEASHNSHAVTNQMHPCDGVGRTPNPQQEDHTHSSAVADTVPNVGEAVLISNVSPGADDLNRNHAHPAVINVANADTGSNSEVADLTTHVSPGDDDLNRQHPHPASIDVAAAGTGSNSGVAGLTPHVSPGDENSGSDRAHPVVIDEAIAETGSNSGVTGLTLHVSSGADDLSRDVPHPAVIDEIDNVDIPHNLSSEIMENSENTEILEDSRSYTNSPTSVGSVASNVMISEGGTNSSGSSGLNIYLPDNENNSDHDILLPGTGDGSDKTQDVIGISDQENTHNVLNATLKTQENSIPDQLPQSGMHPMRSSTDVVTSTSRADVTSSMPSVQFSVSSRSVTLPQPTLTPSDNNIIFQSSDNSNDRLTDELNGSSRRLITSHTTSSIHFTETLVAELIVTRLSPSETIFDTTITATTTHLRSAALLFPTYTEPTHIQLMTTFLYEPTVTSLHPSDQTAIMKINEINEGTDNGIKDYPQPASKIETIQTSSGVFTSSTTAANSLHILVTEGITTKISISPNLLSLSSTSSALHIGTPAGLPAKATIGVPTAADDTQEDLIMTTAEPTKEGRATDISNTDINPWTPEAVTLAVTLEIDSTSGNTMPSDTVPSSFMELKFGMSWTDFCHNEVSIRGELVEIIQEKDQCLEITPDQLQLMNREKQECYQVHLSEEDEISVRMYLMNKSHQFDRSLTLMCARILVSDISVRENGVIKDKLLDVSIHGEDNVTLAISATTQPDEDDQDTSNPFSDAGVVIAVALASVGGCYCLGLVILQVIVRHRSKSLFIPGLSRSYSVTSSDSIQLSSVNKSRPNSGLYNPGLDITDSLEPSNPLTFIHLATFCVDENNIYEEYQRIPSRMPRMSVVPAGEEDKNRYANVLPLVNTRVKLHHDGHEPRSSYINANYITGPKNQSQYYIATQAPTDKTTSDFWSMVWQQGCGAIVMLTQLEEEGQVKCASYWPELVGKSAAQRHGDFLVELKQKDVHQEYIASKLEINNLREIETREIDHFWYTCWPAVGVPEPISLVKLVLDTRPKYEYSNSPVVVHCSPGTGRTCTFIALDLCMRQFEDRRIVDVMRTIYVMRQERAGAIQNKEQYALLYNSLNEYATIVVSPAISAASSATTLHALLAS